MKDQGSSSAPRAQRFLGSTAGAAVAHEKAPRRPRPAGRIPRDKVGGAGSVLVWMDEIEGPVDHTRSCGDVADLAGDAFVDAGAAGDRSGELG